MPPATTRNVGEIRRTVVNDFVNRHVDIMKDHQQAAIEQQQQFNPPKLLSSQQQLTLEKIGEVSGEDDDRSHSSTADASTSASSIESYNDDTSGGGNSSSAAAVRISNLRKKHLSKLRNAEHRVQVMNDMSSVSSYELDESMSVDLSSKGTGFSEWDNDSLGNILSTGPPPTAKPMMMRRSGSPGSMGVEAPPKPMPAVSPAVAVAPIGPPINPRNRHAELALRIQEALQKFDQVSDRVLGNKDSYVSSPATSQRPTVQVANVHSLDAREAAATYVGVGRRSSEAHRHGSAQESTYHPEKSSQRRSPHAVPNQDTFATAHRSMEAVGPDVRSNEGHEPQRHHRDRHGNSNKEPAELQFAETSSSATHSSSSCTLPNRFERRYSDLEDDDDTVQAKVEDDESEVAWRWPIFICCFVCLMIIIVILVASIVAVTVVEVGKHKTTPSSTGSFSMPVQPPVTAPIMIPVQQPVAVAPVQQPVTASAPQPVPTKPVTAPVLAPELAPVRNTSSHNATATRAHNNTNITVPIPVKSPIHKSPVHMLPVNKSPVHISPVHMPTKHNFVPILLAPSMTAPHQVEHPTVNHTANSTHSHSNPTSFTTTPANSSRLALNETKHSSSTLSRKNHSGRVRRRHR